ncbi:MAG TPA: MotA/TolQ/ExbB proton channel family protein, partial [Pirellulaceae bacterium]
MSQLIHPTRPHGVNLFRQTSASGAFGVMLFVAGGILWGSWSSPLWAQRTGPEPSASRGAGETASATILKNNLEGVADDRGVDAAAAPSRGGISGAVEYVVKGGILMVPLVICSFVVFVFIFERTISLRRARVVPRTFVRMFLEQLRDGALTRKEAIALCRDNGSPVAEVFEAGVIKWDRPSVEVEQSIIDAGERVAGQLRKHLRLLHGIYTISPLLGLLGTVVGMIQS